MGASSGKSEISPVLSNADFLVKEWRAAGFNVPSGNRAEASTVEERLVVRVVGSAQARTSPCT